MKHTPSTQNSDTPLQKGKSPPRFLIFLSGVIWLGIGLFLLSLGSSFTLRGCSSPGPFSLAGYLSRTIKDPGQVAVVLLSTGIFLGYLKGRFMLVKAAQKQITRLMQLPRPVRLKQLYARRYYALLLVMIGLGMSLRYFPISLDIRGVIDVAIGMALVSGALHYFRALILLSSSSSTPSQD